ncbi:MAG: NAD(P)-dependent oxidoreductase [Mesorhizobium sp.]
MTSAHLQDRLAFIGVGQMGGPMLRHLVSAGHRVIAFDAIPPAVEEFPSVRFADTAISAARGATVVITMLPDASIMREVVLGGGGVASVLAPDALLIDMGSSDPYVTRDVGEALGRLGLRMIDAPVSGGVSKAKTGQLAIMAGGASHDVESATPILQAMGSKVFHVGDLGAGQAMKALNNLVSAAGLLAVVEALRIGEKFGLDPARMVDVLNASTGRNNTTENKARQFMLSGTYASGFAMRLMVKDMASALNIARTEGVAAAESEVCLESWSQALTALGSNADHTAIHQWLST